MNEFDMLPDSSVMDVMAREYDEAEARRALLEGGELSIRMRPASPKCVGIKCGSDVKGRKIFSEIYFLLQDMIMALRQLHTVAPREYRDEISDCIRIKKKNGELILKCYYNATSDKLTYAPNLAHDRDFCRLLRHIEKSQQRLLVMLGNSRTRCVYVTRVFDREISVSYILSCIAVGCRR